MAKNKIKLNWIANDAARRSTFNKRKRGMVKKCRELSTLCSVVVAMVIFPPNSNEPAAFYPDDRAEVERIFRQFRELPDMERSRRSFTLEGFLRQKISKTRAQNERHDKVNRKLELHDFALGSLGHPNYLSAATLIDIVELSRMIDGDIEAIEERIKILRGDNNNNDNNNNNPQQANPPLPPPPPPPYHAESSAAAEARAKGKAPMVEEEEDNSIQAAVDAWQRYEMYMEMGRFPPFPGGAAGGGFGGADNINFGNMGGGEGSSFAFPGEGGATANFQNMDSGTNINFQNMDSGTNINFQSTGLQGSSSAFPGGGDGPGASGGAQFQGSFNNNNNFQNVGGGVGSSSAFPGEGRGVGGNNSFQNMGGGVGSSSVFPGDGGGRDNSFQNMGDVGGSGGFLGDGSAGGGGNFNFGDTDMGGASGGPAAGGSGGPRWPYDFPPPY